MTISNLEISAQVYDYLRTQAAVKKAAAYPDPTPSSRNLAHEISSEEMTLDEQDATESIRTALNEMHILDIDDETVEKDDIPDLMESLLSIIPLTPDGLKDLIQGTNGVYRETLLSSPKKKQKQGLKKTLLRLLD